MTKKKLPKICNTQCGMLCSVVFVLGQYLSCFCEKICFLNLLFFSQRKKLSVFDIVCQLITKWSKIMFRFCLRKRFVYVSVGILDATNNKFNQI